ncbi:MAG: 16S rRNA (cytidine(1402)-2'-O)-methyltransferase [Chloroflexi bacterium]|nr:16S rRNA (cytidine(1402)-2'-O)-methyltransferase [Chloroflexota bacterium]
MPTLYVVGTPIGNLEDVTLRALRVLREVGLIAAEDTRTTRKLLAAHDIHTPLVSYHGFSRPWEVQRVLAALEDRDVALVSEAGTPGISDPGYDLIQAAIERGIPVRPVPGPSALTAALAVAGLPTHRVLFLGFLPRRPAERRKLLRSLVDEEATLVAFASPHRLRSDLEDLGAILGDRPLAVCRELTKVYEEVFRGTPAEALAYFPAPRGECTLVIGGASRRRMPAPEP